MKTIKHKGAVYIESESSVRLPPSYSADEEGKVLVEIDVAARAIINSLKPSEKPIEDFGHALSFVIEALFSRMETDPAVQAVDSKTLPKQLRRAAAGGGPKLKKIYDQVQKALDSGEITLPPVGKTFKYKGHTFKRDKDFNGKPNYGLIGTVA